MRLMKIQYGSLYLFESNNAYWEIYSEYGQFWHQKDFNWLNFTFFNFDIEYSRFVGNSFTIQLSFLGIVTRFHWMISENEGSEDIKDTLDDIKTTTEAHLEEKIALLDWMKTILPKKGAKTALKRLDSKVKSIQKDIEEYKKEE